LLEKSDDWAFWFPDQRKIPYAFAMTEGIGPQYRTATSDRQNGTEREYLIVKLVLVHPRSILGEPNPTGFWLPRQEWSVFGASCSQCSLLPRKSSRYPNRDHWFQHQWFKRWENPKLSWNLRKRQPWLCSRERCFRWLCNPVCWWIGLEKLPGLCYPFMLKLHPFELCDDLKKQFALRTRKRTQHHANLHSATHLGRRIWVKVDLLPSRSIICCFKWRFYTICIISETK